MAEFVNTRQSPGLNRPFNNFPPDPIVLNRPPTVNDRGSDFGQLWIQNQDTAGNLVNLVWVFTNPGVWTAIEAGGGSGDFDSLTVTPGPISLTGTTTIEGNTTINSGGIGDTNIGTAGNVGTTVIGSLSLGSGIIINVGSGAFALNGGGNIVSIAADATHNTVFLGSTNTTASTTIQAGSGGITLTGAVTATTGIQTPGPIGADTLYATGDLGGVVSTTGLTNVTATAAGGGTVTFAANGGTNITQTGWMKMYVGTTAVFVPYFSSIA